MGQHLRTGVRFSSSPPTMKSSRIDMHCKTCRYGCFYNRMFKRNTHYVNNVNLSCDIIFLGIYSVYLAFTFNFKMYTSFFLNSKPIHMVFYYI